MGIESFLNYLLTERNYSPHTIEAYGKDLNQFTSFLSTEFDITSAGEVKPPLIRSWVISLMEDESHPATVARKISAVRSWYRYLLRKGEVKVNPAARVILPKKPRRLPDFVDKASLDRLFDSALFEPGPSGERDRLIMELFYFTGMRLSELINLKREDVDFYNLWVRVTGKRNKQRMVPLTVHFATSLSQFIENSDRGKVQPADYFFVTDAGKKLYPKFVYTLVNNYLSKVARQTKKSPHTLRHSFATHMLNNGADINSIKTLLGHESLAATQVYTHNTIDRLKTIHKQAHPRG